MTIRRTFVLSQLRRCGASLLALGLVAITGTVSGEQVKQPSERDARRIRRSAPPDSAARQRFLAMFARAYFPGRTGQLLIVPREGDFITRPDANVEYMHGSPWSYDVSIPLMFAGPAVTTGVFSGPHLATATLAAFRRGLCGFGARGNIRRFRQMQVQSSRQDGLLG